MEIVYILTFFVLGTFVGGYATTWIERLPYDDEFHLQIFEELGGDDQEVEVHWWMRLPFAMFFADSPFDYPLKWYDKVPLLPHFVYAFKFARFKKLVPRSHCRLCRTNISWIHRIPLVSFILLGGRCAACRTKIPGRMPVVELLTGLGYALMAYRFGFCWLTLLALFVTTLFIVASVVDWRHRIIPDELNVLGLLGSVGFVLMTTILVQFQIVRDVDVVSRLGDYTFYYSRLNLEKATLGFLTCAGALYLFAEIGGVLAGTDAMGGGDIKLAGWVGVLLGPRGAAVALFYSILIAAPCGVLVLILGAGKREGGFTKFAFGPYICMGAGLVLYYGTNRMIYAYVEMYSLAQRYVQQIVDFLV